MRGVIVTGTDTGVGKTVVSALLLSMLKARGHVVRYWKPIQTGSPPDDDTAEVVRLASLSPEEAIPPAIRLRMPASPYEAALAEGADVPLFLRLPSGQPEDAVWVVEGAGGLRVPTHARRVTMADLFSEFGLPLVVVARPEVGTLNHTLLTLEAARADGMEVLAVVVSRPPTKAVVETMASHGIARVLVVPSIPSVSPASVAETVRDLGKRPEFASLCERAEVVRPYPIEEFVRTWGAEPRFPAFLARDAASLWHPYTQHGFASPPLIVTAAHEANLWLASGAEILDGISSWWTTLHGHCHPVIASAIARTARELDHVIFAGATHEPGVRLAERLLALAPPGLDRVFYSDDGSTAVETALKMALGFHARRGATERTRFLALEHGYHGDTVGAMSVSSDSPFTRDFRPLRFDCARIPVPVHGRREADCLQVLDDLLAREGEQFAAMIVEPLLMGAGGMLVTSRSFLRGIRERTQKHGVLLIADEVLTGFGRTGAMFACERAGITPDLLCLGKALTGGTLTLAATLATGAIYSAFLSDRREDAFLHGHSFTGNPIACAAALASLSLLDAAALDRAGAIGDRIGAGLSSLTARRGVREIRGIGLVRAVELSDPDHRGYLADVGPKMAAVALEHGVLLRPLGSVLYALPPLCVTDDECDRIAAAMVAAVEAVLE